MVKPFKCICDSNPSYFQLIKKSCDLKGQLLYITSKMEHFSLKSGCVVRMAKLLQQHQFIVLQ